jgi:hypothetical protein
MMRLTLDERRVLSGAVERTDGFVIVPALGALNPTVVGLVGRGLLKSVEPHELGEAVRVFVATPAGRAAIGRELGRFH